MRRVALSALVLLMIGGRVWAEDVLPPSAADAAASMKGAGRTGTRAFQAR